MSAYVHVSRRTTTYGASQQVLKQKEKSSLVAFKLSLASAEGTQWYELHVTATYYSLNAITQ